MKRLAMRTFAVLAASLIGAGWAIGMLAPHRIVMGGWAGGAILFVFAFVLLAAYGRTQGPAVGAAH